MGQSLNIHHRCDQYRRLSCKNQTKLYHALLKYGYNDFDKHILEICPEDATILTERESYWIAKYDSIRCGYNLREAGSRGRMSNESRRRMSVSAKLRPRMFDDVRQRLSIKHLGHQVSEETRKKISEAKKGKKFGPLSDSWKRSISLANLGRKQPKISAIQTGRRRKPFTEEHKARIRSALLAKWAAKKSLLQIDTNTPIRNTTSSN